jgi:hypothetical protein
MRDLAAGFLLDAAQVLADTFQVAAELSGVFHAVTSNFFNNGILHRTASNNSSGEKLTTVFSI